MDGRDSYITDMVLLLTTSNQFSSVQQNFRIFFPIKIIEFIEKQKQTDILYKLI